MQPAIVVTGVSSQRLVRVPCEVGNELDAEAVFIAANRIESPIRADLANLGLDHTALEHLVSRRGEPGSASRSAAASASRTPRALRCPQSSAMRCRTGGV